MAVAAFLGLAAWLLRGAVTGGFLYRRDTNMVWLPLAESFVRCVADGSWPLWDPWSGFGRPLLADPRAEVLYPVTWLNLVLDPATFHTLFSLGHLVFAGLGAWALARRLGASPAAALGGGVVWMASGPLVSLVAMWHHLAGAAWMPWVVLAFVNAMSRPGSRSTALAAAALAAQVLAGSPENTVLTALLVGAFLIAGVPGEPLPAWRRLREAALAAALGLALSAAQWVPTAEVVRRSARATQGSAAAATWSLHPLTAVETALPLRWADVPLTREALRRQFEDKEPWLASLYLGALALPLAAVGGATRAGPPLLAVAAAGALFALGRHTPLHGLATEAVPALSMLRFPVKAMVAVALAVSLLAALGLERVGRDDGRSRRLLAAGAALLAAVLLVAYLSLSGAFPGGWHLSGRLGGPVPPAVTTTLAAYLVAGLVLAPVLIGLASRAPRLLVPAMTLALAADLLARHGDLNPAVERAFLRHRPPALAHLDRSEFGRAWVDDYSITDADPRGVKGFAYRLARQPEGWSRGAALALGVHDYLNPPTAARFQVAGSYDLDILGFDPPALVEIDRRLRLEEAGPAHLRLLRLGAVRNAVTLVRGPWTGPLVPVATLPGFFEDPIRVYRVPDALPRARLVDGVSVTPPAMALERMLDPGFDPAREVVLPEGVPAPPGEGSPGSARLAWLACDAMAVEVDAARPALLVLADAWDPGWRARVGGRLAPVLPANAVFRAVPVPVGRHVVRLSYRPSGLLWGGVLGLLGMAAGVWLGRPAYRKPNTGGKTTTTTHAHTA